MRLDTSHEKITKVWNNYSLPNTTTSYTDPNFPPNVNSLLSLDKNNNYIDQDKGKHKAEKFRKGPRHHFDTITWKKLSSDTSTRYKWFDTTISPSDVLQGQLGNCYFISSLATLAKYPYLIERLFLTKEYNPLGYYNICLFIDGEWQIVTVDDSLPYSGYYKRIMFCHPNNNNIIWPMWLEKAWAKVNGGYTNIIGDETRSAFLVLTSFGSMSYRRGDWNTTKKQNDFIDDVIQSSNRKCIMSASSNAWNDENTNGIVGNHAYSLLEVRTYLPLKLTWFRWRNPWGKLHLPAITVITVRNGMIHLSNSSITTNYKMASFGSVSRIS